MAIARAPPSVSQACSYPTRNSARLSWKKLRSTFNRTIATLEQVISQLPPDGDPTIWARAQSTLGDACVGRAESAGPELKPGFLARAVAAYEAAADKRDDQRTVHEDAQLRLQLGTTLNELAGLSNTSERRDLLRRATNELRAAAREFGKKQYSIERAETQVVLARVFGQLADLAEGTDRVDALTQAIIEFEDAIGVLDPEGVVRGDEIRAEIARLLWRRRLARVQLGESSEATMDAARVVTHCDIVLDHEGTKQRNPSLYQELMGLRREASLGTASRSPVTVSSQVISPGPDTGPK